MNFARLLARYIGETVTIFTTSGGESGSGFTGVVLSVNNNFVRLVTSIGHAPGCALGNCCNPHGRDRFDDGFRRDDEGRFSCRGNRIGSVVDIPIDRIAAFVHNAV